MVLAQRQKYRSMEQNRKPRDKSTHLWTPFFQQRRQEYTMFMDQKNQYSENEDTTQSNLQIQCNPYQTTNVILHLTRKCFSTICMETQKTLNSQSNTEEE